MSKKLWSGAQPFFNTCQCIFFARVVDILDIGHSRSGHQITSSDLTSEKKCNARYSYTDWPPVALTLSRVDIRNSVYKYLSQNLDIGDLRSGQFATSQLCICQWEKIERRLFWTKPLETFSNIGLRVDLTSWIGRFQSVIPPHVPDVISGHAKGLKQFFGKNFWKRQATEI